VSTDPVSTDLQGLLDGIPAVATYGLRIEDTKDGVRLRGDLGTDSAVYRGLSHAHGGVVASILDTAATFAVLATTGMRWVTVDLRVDYLRPTPLGAITCSARVASSGGRLGVVQAELSGSGSEPTALAVATMYRTGDRTDT
jgi:uncharacterized protein (TIGR00369 family)